MAPVAALLATVVAAVVCRRLALRWSRGGRRSPALLAWTVSFGLTALASTALLVGLVVGWSTPVFDAFVLFGAVLGVPWLALGSVLVHADDAWTTRAVAVVCAVAGLAFLVQALRGEVVAVPGAVLGVALAAAQWATDAEQVRVRSSLVVVAATLAAAVAVLLGGPVAPLPGGGLPDGGVLLAPVARGFAVGGNVVGSVVVVAGALLAAGRLAWRTRAADPDGAVEVGWRRQLGQARSALRRADLDHVVRGELLVVAGIVVAAGSGVLLWFLGDATAHAVGVAAGVVLLDAGLDRTTRPASERRGPGPVPPPVRPADEVVDRTTGPLHRPVP